MFTKFFTPLFILFLFLWSCEEDEDIAANQITSEEYSEGIFYALHQEGIL